MRAGDYPERFEWKAQTSSKGNGIGAENEDWPTPGTMLWGALYEAEAAGVPGGRQRALEIIEDNYIKSFKIAMIKIRNYVAIKPQDKLVQNSTGEEWDVTGVRYGNNETLVNVEN